MKRILLIEDEDILRVPLQRMIERAGYEVVSCDDGGKGLQQVQLHGPFDAVITDIIMPEVEGIDVILRLRDQHPTLPILAISGGGRNSAHSYLEMAGILGANLTLAKPFYRQDLVRAIESLTNPQADACASAAG